MTNKEKYEGKIFIANSGTKFKIIEYNKYSDIKIEFLDEFHYSYNTTLQYILKGSVRNPYDKSVCGVGYLGEFKYPTKENGKFTKCYSKWTQMINRCYNEKALERRKEYTDCKVYSKWLNYSNFEKWFYKNYYEIKGEEMHLDKDILYKGNKIYSPKKCIIVPKRINDLFAHNTVKNNNLPIGVHINYSNNKNSKKIYQAQLSFKNENNNKEIRCKKFDNVEDAFLWYKQKKEKYIKMVAEQYKDLIPIKLYKALYSYKVERDD